LWEIYNKAKKEIHIFRFVPSPPDFSYGKSGLCVGGRDAGGYHRPKAGNLILVGSEDPACDTKDWVDDPDNFNRDITQSHWEAQVYRLAKRIPSLPIPRRPKGIVDLYNVTDDWSPIYDKSDLPGFYFAIGTRGNQYKNGPVIGRLLAEIIEACENGHNHDSNPA
jgi:sarcosine oxidase subunit beta